jgi:disulfide bond formation protein DsbB
MLRSNQIGMLVGAIALALILGALGFQYFAHIQPCRMCHWQRWALIAAAVVGILGSGFLPRRTAHLVALAAILFVAVSGLIAAYQSGMQLGILPDPQVCEVDHPFMYGSPVVPVVLCTDKGWTLLGLSLAAYNAIISLTVAIIGGGLLTTRKEAD